MNGWQLADAMQAQRPGLPVLFITGYAGVEAMQEQPLPSNMLVLRKPFTFAAFLDKVATILAADLASGPRSLVFTSPPSGSRSAPATAQPAWCRPSS